MFSFIFFYHFIFHFFFIFSFFYHFLIIISSIVEKKEKKWKIAIFLEFFHFLIIFLSFLLPVVELMKNDKKMKKNEKQTRGKLQFSKK